MTLTEATKKVDAMTKDERDIALAEFMGYSDVKIYSESSMIGFRRNLKEVWIDRPSDIYIRDWMECMRTATPFIYHHFVHDILGGVNVIDYEVGMFSRAALIAILAGGDE